ncbi:MAG: peptidoglycan endopeptidase [Chthoniobacterales bacterium]
MMIPLQLAGGFLAIILIGSALAETFLTPRVTVVTGQATLLIDDAPEAVKRAVDAANRIVGKPYKPAGGHGEWEDDGYDCSGSVSYVLHGAGLLEEARASGDYLEYGEPGPGKWITVFVRPGHVFLVIGDARFDTTDHENIGPGWREAVRVTEGVKGFAARHPKDL